MQKHQHGGNIRLFSQEIGCDIKEVIDLSSNINFVKPRLDIDFNQLNISSYPNYDALYQAVATLYNIEKKQLELFNGATSAIHILFRDLKLKQCTLYAPLYSEYKKSALLYGYEIKPINRLKDIGKEVVPNSLVIFVNPSTPDGEFYDIDKLMREWIAKECTILIDESFLDFTPFESATKYLKEYNKLYIVKSMTKFYSSAGIRIGAIISNSKNIERIKQHEPLWKISEFDSQYLQSALRDQSFSKKSREIHNSYRDELIEILEATSFIDKIYPSYANFIMVKLKDIDATSLQKKLIPYKIMVRDCSNFDFLDKQFVRIAIKDNIAIQKLKEALCEIST